MEHALETPRGLFKTRSVGSSSGPSDSGVGTENELPGDADTVG